MLPELTFFFFFLLTILWCAFPWEVQQFLIPASLVTYSYLYRVEASGSFAHSLCKVHCCPFSAHVFNEIMSPFSFLPSKPQICTLFIFFEMHGIFSHQLLLYICIHNIFITYIMYILEHPLSCSCKSSLIMRTRD